MPYHADIVGSKLKVNKDVRERVKNHGDLPVCTVIVGASWPQLLSLNTVGQKTTLSVLQNKSTKSHRRTIPRPIKLHTASPRNPFILTSTYISAEQANLCPQERSGLLLLLPLVRQVWWHSITMLMLQMLRCFEFPRGLDHWLLSPSFPMEPPVAVICQLVNPGAIAKCKAIILQMQFSFSLIKVL